MNLKIACLLTAAVFAALLLFLPQRKTSIVPGKSRAPARRLEAYGTFQSLGVTATIGSVDDPTTGAKALLQYRAHGESDFRSGFPLARVDRTHFVGSLFRLTPGTTYDLRVQFEDANRGPLDGATLETAAATRPAITIPKKLDFIFVSPRGNDETGRGLVSRPYATIARALRDAKPGMEIILRGGIYFEGNLAIRDFDGAASAPLVIRGYEGERAILDGAAPDFQPRWSREGALWTTPLDGDLARAHMVASGGRRLFPYQSLDDLRLLKWNVPGFHADPQDNVLRLNLPREDPRKMSLTLARRNHAFAVTNARAVYFRDLTFRHYGYDAAGAYLTWPRALEFRDADDCLVERCDFHLNDLGVCVTGNTDRLVIQDCTFSDTVYDWPRDATKNGGARLETGGVRVYSPYTGRGLVIRRNEVGDFLDGLCLCPYNGGPWNLAGVSNETDCHDNIIRRIDDDAIEADGQSVNTRIWGNTFEECMIGISLSPTFVGPVWCLRNLAYGSEPDGSSTQPFKISHNGFAGPMFLFHNTSYTEKGFYVGGGRMSWRLLYCRNNVWRATVAHAFSQESPDAPADWDYDALQAADYLQDVGLWGNRKHTLATLQAANDQELHGRIGDPGFADPKRRDFRPAPGSPLIDAGEHIPGINDGFLGAAPDIGRFEHGE